MTESFAGFRPLAISCLNNNPNDRPTVVKVLTEIKEIKNAIRMNGKAKQLLENQQQIQQEQLQKPLKVFM